MIAGLLRDILLPRSDLIASVQVALVVVITAVVLSLVRRERSLVLFTTGLGLTVLGLMSLRTLH
ncbi:MAG: hypothetical protein ABIP17_15155 [Ilumatobacteraceae bacterium]